MKLGISALGARRGESGGRRHYGEALGCSQRTFYRPGRRGEWSGNARRGQLEGGFNGFRYGRQRDSGAVARDRRRLETWKMKRKRRGLGVVAAGGARRSGSTDLDQR
jgi:hypothetical protein